MNGEDILWVSNMLGHTDSTMTLSRYARYIKRDDKRRATFLENKSGSGCWIRTSDQVINSPLKPINHTSLKFIISRINP